MLLTGLPLFNANIMCDNREKKTIHVVAAIIRRGNEIFASQRGYGEFKEWWEFPGGKIELGETPEEVIVREIKKELATDIEVVEFLTTVEYDYPGFYIDNGLFMMWSQGRGTNAPRT